MKVSGSFDPVAAAMRSRASLAIGALPPLAQAD
jgi:hypothetical protein